MKRKKKHQKLIDDYDTQKRKHLEKLSTKMLENDEKMLKKIKSDIVDIFIPRFLNNNPQYKNLFKNTPFFVELPCFLWYFLYF